MRKGSLESQVKRLRTAGKTVKEIAQSLECHVVTVYRHLRNFSDKSQETGLTEEGEKWLIQNSHLPLSTLSKELGESQQTVCGYFQKLGISKKRVPSKLAFNIVEGLHRGRSQSQVARDLGISKQRVSYNIKMYKDSIPPKAPGEDAFLESNNSTLEIQIIRYLREGLRAEEISAKLGVSARVVTTVEGQLSNIS